MARTPEGKVKDDVKKVLAKYRVWYFMPVSNGFGKHGIPDFICCVAGRFFTVETKAPGKKPTELQEDQMNEIRKAGGKAFVVDGDTCLLVNWLDELC